MYIILGCYGCLSYFYHSFVTQKSRLVCAETNQCSIQKRVFVFHSLPMAKFLAMLKSKVLVIWKVSRKHWLLYWSLIKKQQANIANQKTSMNRQYKKDLCSHSANQFWRECLQILSCVEQCVYFLLSLFWNLGFNMSF